MGGLYNGPGMLPSCGMLSGGPFGTCSRGRSADPAGRRRQDVPSALAGTRRQKRRTAPNRREKTARRSGPSTPSRPLREAARTQELGVSTCAQTSTMSARTAINPVRTAVARASVSFMAALLTRLIQVVKFVIAFAF